MAEIAEGPPPAPVKPPVEQIKAVEPVKSPEKELFNSHFRALHGRILLGGDALNPDNKNISPITKEALANGSPQLLNECATNCRKKVATVEKDQLEGEINSRVANNTLVLKQDFSKIEGFDQEKAARWKSTLSKLFGKDTASATEAEVRALFDKYFYSKDKLGNASDTDLFAEDVLRAFGEEDITQIEENADCIIWYARICGFDQDYSEKVFKHQITAKALHKNNPDQLVEELNQKIENKSSRIDDSNADEDEVLKFIWGNKGKIEIIPEKIETPAKPDETVVEPAEPEEKPTESPEDENLLQQKAIYEKNRDVLDQFLSNSETTIEEVNDYIVNSGMKEITAEGLAKINAAPDMKKMLIIDIYLGQQKRQKIEEKIQSGMSSSEIQQLRYVNTDKIIKQLEAVQAEKPEGLDDLQYGKIVKQAEEQRQKMIKELEKFPKEIGEKISSGEINPEKILKEYKQKFEDELAADQPEIDEQIDALKAQIYKWEGIGEKDEEKSTPTASEEVLNEDKEEEEKKKPNFFRRQLDKLKARIAARKKKELNT